MNREVKKGRQKPALEKGRYSKIIVRDKKYVENMMKMKTEEAKKDWEDVRREFLRARSKLLKGATDVKSKNEMKEK